MPKILNTAETIVKVNRDLIEKSKVAYYQENGKLPTNKVAVEYMINKSLESGK